MPFSVLISGKTNGATAKEEKVTKKYTDKDVEAFKKITAQSLNKKHSNLYTENDFKAFKNILNKKNDNQKKGSIKNIIGKVYEEPVFKPGGDKYMVIEFGNLMDLEINFTSQNLAKAIFDNKIKGIYETAPCFASMLIHYNPDEIKFNDLKNEMKSLIKSLGPTDDIEINSRIFSFPTVYLDKWTRECIEDYSSKIAENYSFCYWLYECCFNVINFKRSSTMVSMHSNIITRSFNWIC